MAQFSGGTGGELDVVVIGAGLSGLLAAREISAAGRRVRVYEKARGPGGRMATRRFGDAVLDHGAQYFTARDPMFQGLVEGWLKEGLIRPWSDGFALADGSTNQNGEPRFVGLQGMTTVPKRLAERLDVHCGATAERCFWSEGAWEVQFKEKPPVRTKALVLTAPAPQSLALLSAGEVVLEESVAAALARIEYTPCLAALVRLTGTSLVPAPGGLWLEGEPVSWMADNTQKGLSDPMLGASITIHAGPQFSRDYWQVDPDEIAAHLALSVQSWLGTDNITATQVHRWRYATPVVVHPARCLATEAPGPVVFAGDGFAGPRVEAAALSGLAAAQAILGAGR